jgi:hypothetical protein
MSQVIVNSMQWSRLKNIGDVEPIGEGDAACLEDIRQVLIKHNALGRFGLTLLHSHFDLADDELMMETTDMDKREHWVRPMKRASLAEAGITAQTTVLTFDEKGFNQNCGCDPRASGHHHK